MKLYRNYPWDCFFKPKYWHLKAFKYQTGKGKTGLCLWFGPLNFSTK